MVGEIYGIAAKNGWSVSMSVKNGIRSYDFQRKTLSGVAFSFTAEVKDDKAAALRMRLYLLRMQSIPTFVLGNG